MFQLENTNILPGQQKSLHLTGIVLEPLHFFPPHTSSHTLVLISVPPPQVLLHGPVVHGVHSPSTTEGLTISYQYKMFCQQIWGQHVNNYKTVIIIAIK